MLVDLRRRLSSIFLPLLSCVQVMPNWNMLPVSPKHPCDCRKKPDRTMRGISTTRYFSTLAMCLASIQLLAGCTKENVAVSIHGVNYTGQTFGYVIEDPANESNRGGGELIDAYSSGGAMCCYALPSTWRPGIQVRIIGRHWLEQKADGSLPEIVETKIVEVPKYVDGKAGELWVLREANGALSIVSSDYQPDHAKWPGKIKGWPVPSLEYTRSRWDIAIEHEAGGVRLFQNLLQKMKTSPSIRAEESWRFAQAHEPESVAGFTGPNDKRYHAFLVRNYEEGLSRSAEKLRRLKEQRP